jgi:metal-responsive CopG/Arc/MetJ family transcriptional regulator
MPVRNYRRVNLLIDHKLDRKLDRLAERANKSRSAVIRDAILRMLWPVPDADLSDSGTHHQK